MHARRAAELFQNPLLHYSLKDAPHSIFHSSYAELEQLGEANAIGVDSAAIQFGIGPDDLDQQFHSSYDVTDLHTQQEAGPSAPSPYEAGPSGEGQDDAGSSAPIHAPDDLRRCDRYRRPPRSLTYSNPRRR